MREHIDRTSFCLTSAAPSDDELRLHDLVVEHLGAPLFTITADELGVLRQVAKKDGGDAWITMTLVKYFQDLYGVSPAPAMPPAAELKERCYHVLWWSLMRMAHLDWRVIKVDQRYTVVTETLDEEELYRGGITVFCGTTRCFRIGGQVLEEKYKLINRALSRGDAASIMLAGVIYGLTEVGAGVSARKAKHKCINILWKRFLLPAAFPEKTCGRLRYADLLVEILLGNSHTVPPRFLQQDWRPLMIFWLGSRLELLPELLLELTQRANQLVDHELAEWEKELKDSEATAGASPGAVKRIGPRPSTWPRFLSWMYTKLKLRDGTEQRLRSHLARTFAAPPHQLSPDLDRAASSLRGAFPGASKRVLARLLLAYTRSSTPEALLLPDEVEARRHGVTFTRLHEKRPFTEVIRLGQTYTRRWANLPPAILRGFSPADFWTLVCYCVLVELANRYLAAQLRPPQVEMYFKGVTAPTRKKQTKGLPNPSNAGPALMDRLRRDGHLFWGEVHLLLRRFRTRAPWDIRQGIANMADALLEADRLGAVSSYVEQEGVRVDQRGRQTFLQGFLHEVVNSYAPPILNMKGLLGDDLYAELCEPFGQAEGLDPWIWGAASQESPGCLGASAVIQLLPVAEARRLGRWLSAVKNGEEEGAKALYLNLDLAQRMSAWARLGLNQRRNPRRADVLEMVDADRDTDGRRRPHEKNGESHG